MQKVEEARLDPDEVAGFVGLATPSRTSKSILNQDEAAENEVVPGGLRVNTIG